jgi:hypothetical protein
VLGTTVVGPTVIGIATIRRKAMRARRSGIYVSGEDQTSFSAACCSSVRPSGSTVKFAATGL